MNTTLIYMLIAVYNGAALHKSSDADSLSIIILKLKIITQQILSDSAMTEQLPCLFKREPPCPLDLAGQLEFPRLHNAGKAQHKVVMLRVVIAFDIADFQNLQPGFLPDFPDGGLLCGFLLLDEPRHTDIVISSVGLLYQRKPTFSVRQQADYAGIGKAEPRTVAAPTERDFSLVADLFRCKLSPALGTEMELQSVHFLFDFLVPAITAAAPNAVNAAVTGISTPVSGVDLPASSGASVKLSPALLKVLNIA